MSERTLVQAVNAAMARAMAEDPRVVLLGEDIGVDGGVFRATEGLLARFGTQRVIDTPLAEAGLAGLGIGLAAQGFRPVVEIQFSGFLGAALDQVLNHAARMRTRTRGRITCPMVIRAPSGGGVHAPEHHSESPEAIFAHVPGLRVVLPSSPARAFGLLLAAIADPDPVVFLEPTRLYRALREEVPDDAPPLPLDRAFVLREGNDATIVAWGGMVPEALAAAAALAPEGIGCEVIDLATLKPMDEATVLASVARTGRVVIVQEAPLTAGFGAEVAARVAERGLMSLRAPIRRVAGWDTVMPLPRLEQRYLPDAARIAAAVRDAMRFP